MNNQAETIRRKRLTGLAMIPVFLLLHNLEEALTISAALPVMQVTLFVLTGRHIDLPTAEQYQAALLVLTFVGFVLWGLAKRWDRLSYALVILQAVMALNVFAHVVNAILLRGYAPGLITALLLQLPLSIVVYRHLRRRMWLSAAQWRWLPFYAVLLHGPGLIALLMLVRST